MEQQENKPHYNGLGFVLSLGSWLVLNGIFCYLAYLVYSKGISGELIIFIITSIITLDLGIIVAVLRSRKIKVNLKEVFDSKQKKPKL